MSDQQLLRNYAERRSEEAFAELVRRYVDLIYSAALRMVRDTHLAEDVTQSVFVIFARNARQLMDLTVFSGWLHRTAQNIAAQSVRSDVRRRAREQEAAAMNQLLATESETLWEQIAPHLDAALGELAEPDRDALLLRYFERKSAREMARALGTTEEAAQKRVSRAVERLRDFLAKRGVTVGAGGLVAIVTSNAVQAAPIGLAAAISATAIMTGTAASSATIIAASKTIAMTTLQKTLVTATIAAAVSTGIYQAHQASTLRTQNQALQQQQAPFVEHMQQVERERDDATNRLTLLANEIAKNRSNNAELLRLRAQIARLRSEAASTPAEASLKTWARQVALLKQKLELMPDKQIPELQFATEKDWANAVWGADLNTDDGIREALSKLREEAQNKFLNEMTGAALKKYLAAHDGILPADLYQLKPYFDVPVTDAMLQRYKLLQTGKPDRSAALVTSVGYADPDYDSNHQISLDGASGGRFNRVQQAVEIAAADFAKDNNGQIPTVPSQITAYLRKPIEAATIQKYLTLTAADPPPPELGTLSPAVKAYQEANNGASPNDGLELAPYLTTPEQKAALLRLENLPPEAAALGPALQAYVAAHPGQVPTRASDLLPYVKTAEEKTALQKVEQMRNGQR